METKGSNNPNSWFGEAIVLALIVVVLGFVLGRLSTVSNVDAATPSRIGSTGVNIRSSSGGMTSIIYDKETNVEYFLSYHGVITPVYDKDGNLKIHKAK